MSPTRALYPAVLDLTGAGVTVLGAGAVALQKLQGLPRGLAWVRVVAPQASPEVEAWIRRRPEARLERRAFEPADLRGCRLLFCCTSDKEVNAYAARQARALGIWTCQAAEPSQGDLQVPAVVDAAGLLVTLSTGGASPALAKALRKRLEAWLKSSDLAWVLRQLERRRPQLKADPVAKRRLLAALCSPAALDLMLAPRNPVRRRRLEKLFRL